MQTIKKIGSMPKETTKGFEKYKNKPWGDIPEEVKTPLRAELEKEQKGLCCYCCQSIVGKSTHIEHLESRQNNPKKYADYDNLLLSCNTSKQCDNAKGDKELPLTPLMTECDIEIGLYPTGELHASTDRAEQAIEILKLNNRKLNNRRKGLADMILFNFDMSQPNSPPFSIRDKQTLSLITHSLPSQQKNELEYIINKLT